MNENRTTVKECQKWAREGEDREQAKKTLKKRRHIESYRACIT